MSSRISLTRIIALNWYGFRQIFDVDDNVLISGAFGTGKSALLDLMQYVLLGEGWRANRAAAGNARGRDLVGYCLGDTNQTRNGQRHFLRHSGVTLVGLEFSRPAAHGSEESRETWGIRLEYSSADAAPKHTYFCIPNRLPYSDIAPDGQLLPDDAFRTWLRREYGNECLFARQRDYLEEMATARHLNFDPSAFHRTFPKAIAFEPEENVERFIREFILEESPLDVREVRSALQAYEDTRRRLEQQEDEAAFLRRISEQHTAYTHARREQATLNFIRPSLEQRQAEERRERHAADLENRRNEHARDLKQLAEKNAEETRVTALLDEVRFEIGKDPDAVKLSQLNREKEDLQQRVNRLRAAEKSIHQKLQTKYQEWLHWLKHGSSLPLQSIKELLHQQDPLLDQLRAGTDQERLDALPKLAARFNELLRAADQAVHPLRQEIASTEKKLRQLADDLEHLSKGRTPGSFPLFHSLRQKLADRVQQLGRLIEVKPEAEAWWPALELYLDSARWALVVDNRDDYRQALASVSSVTPGREPESLLNPDEALAAQPSILDQSLFHLVDIEHPVARAYAAQLLGQVRTVASPDQLESSSAPQSITQDGLLKQPPLRRRLKPASSVELTLGKEGLARMRKLKSLEHENALAACSMLKQQLTDVQTWLDNGHKAGLNDGSLPDHSGELPQLPELESNLGRTIETIHLLNTPEREQRQKQLADLEQKQRRVRDDLALLRDRGQSFALSIKPVEEALAAAEEDAATARLAAEAARIELSRRFTGILDQDLLQRRDAFRAQFSKWNDCFAALQEQITQAAQDAVAAREKRNKERLLLAEARNEHGHLRHPQYQHDFSSEHEDNTPWQQRLDILEQVELDKSRQLAADCKQEWERRLEENVLNELNRRISEAHNTIRLLDRYLSLPIGKLRYRISQRRDNAYAAIWRLLDSGLEPTDPLAAAIKETEVQSAKEELMRAVHAADKTDDRARRLLDYRNYHHYDIEMVPADKLDAPPISLGRSGRNLSGGENQAPFFISMLAAFRRVYDRGDRNSARSRQLGLVVMDEAFSKLSGDGIEDCLALARSFQLQLIMAFPPERLGVMVPHAQTVIMCQKEVERDAEGYVTRIDNIPLMTTMAEAMEALA